MLNTVRTITTGQVQEYSDEFATIDGAQWTHGGWTLFSVASTGLPTAVNGFATVIATVNNDLRTALLADKGISVESYREISLNGWLGPAGGPSVIYLMLDMDDTTPDPHAGGVYVHVEYATTGASINLIVDGTTVDTFSTGNRPPGGTWTTRLTIDAGNTVRVYWTSLSIPDITYNLGVYTATGSRVGFGMRAAFPGQQVYANSFTMRYFLASGSLPAQALVGANNGLVYYESTSGNMVQVVSDLTVDTDEWLSSAARLDKLYIADSEIKSINDAQTASTSVSTLTDAGATFLTQTDPVDADDDMLEITFTDQLTGDGDMVTGTWPISSITDETHIVVTGTLGTGTTVSYRIMRAPKVFDSDVLTLTRLTATAGFVPPNCDIVAVFNDRLCWAGDDLVPEAVYMSKVGDPTDYDYGTNLPDEAFVYDPGRVAGAPFIGDAITALIPHLDDYLVIGCKRSIWFQRADPALGATPEPISREIGILKQSAWCYTPEGTIVAMTLDGLYLIAPGPEGSLQRLSRDRMPQELVNIDTDLNDVLVEYDTLRNGINIFVTPTNPGPTQHFWFGWQMKEFSPETYSSDFEPKAIASHALGGVGPRKVILGCRDGYLRVHEDSAHTDDGENFHSHVLIGPIMLGGNGYYEGMIREVVGQLAEDSGEVTMKIRTGDSIESAYRATSRVSYTMRAGKNRTWRPNLRGNACFIELSSEGGEAWAFEQLSIVRERLGKQRLLA